MALFHRPEKGNRRRREITSSSVREGCERRNAAVRNSFGQTGAKRPESLSPPLPTS